MTGQFGDLEQADYPMDRRSVRGRRIRLVVGWMLISFWEAVPMYLAFMKHSNNPTREVAVALALAVCWIPVIGTAAAVMCAVWAWDIPWWMAVAMYLTPKVIFVLIARGVERRDIAAKK
jgi:fatty acid desaturase